MKDLKSAQYWTTFGELGPNIGRAFMPSPQEVAETVIGLMRERDELAQKLAEAEKRNTAVLANLDMFCLYVANKADELRVAPKRLEAA